MILEIFWSSFSSVTLCGFLDILFSTKTESKSGRAAQYRLATIIIYGPCKHAICDETKSERLFLIGQGRASKTLWIKTIIILNIKYINIMSRTHSISLIPMAIVYGPYKLNMAIPYYMVLITGIIYDPYEISTELHKT